MVVPCGGLPEASQGRAVADALALVSAQPGVREVEAFLDSKADDLAPGSINHLRGFLSRAYGTAIRVGHLPATCANPIATVSRRKIPRRLPNCLTVEEVPRMLRALAPTWRPLFATALYLGLRRGELFALRKVDVDLEHFFFKQKTAYEILA